jgi:hypothetical protein
MQIDYDQYMHELDLEERRGAERARAQGFRMPIEPRAGRQREAEPAAA